MLDLMQRFFPKQKACRDLELGDRLILSDGSEHVVAAAEYATSEVCNPPRFIGGFGVQTAVAMQVIAGPHTFYLHPAELVHYRAA